jgi:two-component system, OmpR family, heavy metal sensor histidine kinase CusS
VGGGYFLARRALAPVRRMTQTANRITADRLGERIAVDNPDDELGALAQTLNRMIERLGHSFAEMQRFTADAAHELRTPLAVIRNEAEVALRSPRTAAEYGRVLENLLEETNRLSHLADQLLFLCRQDAGLLPTVREAVAVDDLLREVVGNMQLVAGEKGVALSLAENPPCQLPGDRRQLRRVFYNLLDNAIKYTGASGRVTVSSQVADGRLCVVVADTGVGIAPEHLPRVFDRFYRVDPSRAGDGDGAGLGLSICQSIVKALGGSIRLESTAGRGTKAQVELPMRH